MGEGVRVGLVVTSIGRPALSELLLSAAASQVPPHAVAVADQSREGLPPPPPDLPFPVTVVRSSGGASAGRNDAARALTGAGVDVDVLGFPNDDSLLPPETLGAVAAAFAVDRPPAAVAATLLDPDGPRFALPPTGTNLDRRTVWRAIEPAMFVATGTFAAVGGFDRSLGTGAGTPWASGEGTDLLLRIMADGGDVVSRPDLAVIGRGERRALGAREYVAKHRGYARGTGYVYRTHGYPPTARARVLVAPLVKAPLLDASLPLALRLALARFLGRFEGLRGRPLSATSVRSWTPPADVRPERQGPAQPGG